MALFGLVKEMELSSKRNAVEAEKSPGTPRVWALGFRAKGFRALGVWGCSGLGFRGCKGLGV